MQTQLLINGELVNGEGEKQPVYNPATGEVLLEIAEASAAQVDAAVQAADRAFASWGRTTRSGWRIPLRPMPTPWRGWSRKTAANPCTAYWGMKFRP